jgi:hypothetical protein
MSRRYFADPSAKTLTIRLTMGGLPKHGGEEAARRHRTIPHDQVDAARLLDQYLARR